MAKHFFVVTETENASDDSFSPDDWIMQTADDAEQAAEFYAERLNEPLSLNDDTGRDFDISVKSEDGSIKRFIVSAQMSWSYSATEKGDAL